MRKIGFRYLLLRGGAYYAQLRALSDSAPRIRCDSEGEIKASFSGTFAPQAYDVDGKPMEIDWLSDEIQPCLILDGVQHPLGVFMPATPKNVNDGIVESVSVEAYDRCWRVRDTNSAALPFWPAGTLYLDAIKQLLVEAGVGTVLAVPSDAAFPEDREDWDIGVSYLSIVNQLLTEINYYPLYFDASGAAILRPVVTPDASSINRTLDVRNREARILPGISRETDIFSAPNFFIVTCSNPDKDDLMVATAANENPQSPLSVQRRGRRICARLRVDNIASQEELQAYADKLRNESLITGESLRISTALMPGCSVNDVVALHYGDLTSLCIERGFDMELRVGGKMNHRLERVVYNLD